MEDKMILSSNRQIPLEACQEHEQGNEKDSVSAVHADVVVFSRVRSIFFGSLRLSRGKYYWYVTLICISVLASLGSLSYLLFYK